MHNLELKLNPFEGKYSKVPDSYKKAEVEEGALVDFRGYKLLKSQYDSLVDLAQQIGHHVEAMFHLGQIKAETGMVTSILMRFNVFSEDYPYIRIPENLTHLEKLEISYNRIHSLQLPASLTRLRYLDCNSNNLTELKIPDSYSNLKFLDCSHNSIPYLRIPKTLKNLDGLIYAPQRLRIIQPPTLETPEENLNALARNFIDQIKIIIT